MFNIKQNEPHQKNKINIIVDNPAVDDEGFLINPAQWTEAFAENTLELQPGELTNNHLKVIHFVRNKYARLSALPPVRQVCKSTGINKSDLKNLFGSCLQLWRATGLPRPDDEVRSHMN